jgi:hypothetical protein
MSDELRRIYKKRPEEASALSIVLKNIEEAIELNRDGRRRCLDADYRDIVDGERTGLEVARGFVKRELDRLMAELTEDQK